MANKKNRKHRKKLQRSDLTSKWSDFKKWIKSKYAAFLHGFAARKKTVKKSLQSFKKKVWNGFIGLVFDNHYGMRLLKTRTAILGYISLIALSVGGIFALDHFDYTRRFLHPNNVNEAVIGTTTILLALLIPVAIALIEDARGLPLARQTIVKSIIRFNAAPLVLLLICVFFFIPQGLGVFGNDVTFRNLYAAILIFCIVFILMSFYRSYRWLSDPSINSSGSPESPPPDEPQPESFFSYRFAHTVRLLYKSKGYETWFIIWSQWFPPEYENVLHTAFFKRQNEVVKKKKIKRYITLSLEVEAYDKYFDKRNKDVWWFYLDYIQQFLLLYADVHKFIESDRKTARAAGLWRGQNALEKINKKLIYSSLDRERIWHLFEAMDKYLNASDLLLVKNRRHPHDSVLLNYFADEYFESIFDGRLDRYHAKSYLKEKPYWSVTYDNLYKHRYNISFVMTDRFKEWLFKKLDSANNTKSKEVGMYEIDLIIQDLFPEVDPTTISDLYWLLYQAQNTTDSQLIVKMHYEEVRPFGVFGRVSMAEWVDDEEVRMKDFANIQRVQEENAIKLFATMYSTYFLRFWNLDELIKISTATLRERGLKDKEKLRLQSFLKRLKAVKKFYKSQQEKSDNRKPQKKKQKRTK